MSKSGAESTLSRLEEEGEVAADYLEEILDIMDLDGDIVIDVENGRPSIAIVSDDPRSALNRLVGEDGEVLEALQELTRLAVQTSMGERSRLMLDVAGYRADRRAELQAIAARAVEEVRETGQPVQLEPMNPFERKVCHDVVAQAGLVSESAGSEPDRCVVISVPMSEPEITQVPVDGVEETVEVPQWNAEVVPDDPAVQEETAEAFADSDQVVEDGTGITGDLIAAEMALDD